MSLPRFNRPKAGIAECSPNLYVANCGPAVGLSFDVISSVFNKYGQVKGVYSADESGTRVIVCFDSQNSAKSAMEALHGRSCPLLGGRSLHIQYSVQSSDPVKDSVQVSLTDSELKVPGVHLLHDFVTAKEEEELLAAVDSRPWHELAKRRVQHYGYEFCYETRNVNTNQCLGELPSFVSSVVERVSLFKKLACTEDIFLDQLTVNEYPIGVGLSPHVDTHSAFEGLIFSLSLAGPCIMEFRKYTKDRDALLSKFTSNFDDEVPDSDSGSNFLRRAIYLPPQSMLLLSGEARYAWHHYIPHHKIDKVNDTVVRRGRRRVSFTFRKVRKGSCKCGYPEYCDSQK